MAAVWVARALRVAPAGLAPVAALGPLVAVVRVAVVAVPAGVKAALPHDPRTVKGYAENAGYCSGIYFAKNSTSFAASPHFVEQATKIPLIAHAERYPAAPAVRRWAAALRA